MNNREIKFRVWDPTPKRFYPQNVLNVLPLDVFLASDSLQQYTGAWDKHGKEVYDGDIVKFGNLNYIIEWNEFSYGWQGRCPYYHKYHHPRLDPFRLVGCSELIGNIMENPELLLKK